MKAHQLIPRPRSAADLDEAPFLIDADTEIWCPMGSPGAEQVAQALAAAMGVPLPVRADGSPRSIHMEVDGASFESDEAYRLLVHADQVRLTAGTVRGLARAAATLAQLIERDETGRLSIPSVEIEDAPRFPWRGFSLDVARSFFPVSEVKQVIDLLARYQFNVLHLHLSDDQGWRLEIGTRPELTEISGKTSMTGGRAGYYSAAEFGDLVSYARARGIEVIPELDVPGHTNAATHACGALMPDGRATAAYGGMQVGFSRLYAEVEETVPFIRDIYHQAALLGSGDYLHIGGDEALELGASEYTRLVQMAVDVVRATGKRIVGWQEIANALTGADVRAEDIVIQFWDPRADLSALKAAAASGAKVLMSPADRIYLDMKYDASTPVGQDWAAFISLQDSYEWEPTTLIEGLPPEAIIGVEGAVWTETIFCLDDLTYLLLPRLTAVAEVAWTAAGDRDWSDFQGRIAAQTPWWDSRSWRWYTASV